MKIVSNYLRKRDETRRRVISRFDGEITVYERMLAPLQEHKPPVITDDMPGPKRAEACVDWFRAIGIPEYVIGESHIQDLAEESGDADGINRLLTSSYRERTEKIERELGLLKRARTVAENALFPGLVEARVSSYLEREREFESFQGCFGPPPAQPRLPY